MKNQLSKKLSAFITTAMLFSASANAQIVYTDVNPDLTFIQDSVGSVSHDIDMNNDGYKEATISESWIEGHTPQNGFFTIKRVDVNCFGGSQLLMYYDGLPLAKPLSNTAIIDSARQSWSDLPFGAILVVNGSGAFGSTGDWSDTTDRYLGIRITVGGDWFYGWVRVSVDPYIISFTISDYAYNSTPNQPILAGQGQPNFGTTENSFASTINLFPNPATSHVTIDFGNNNQKVDVTITDVTGKIMYSTSASETQEIEVNTEDFKAGIYVVQIQAGDFSATKKLVIEK